MGWGNRHLEEVYKRLARCSRSFTYMAGREQSGMVHVMIMRSMVRRLLGMKCEAIRSNANANANA
jgi:hypothetical protein